MPKPTQGELMKALIVRTSDPLMPMYVSNLGNALIAFTKSNVLERNEENLNKIREIQHKILDVFPTETMNELCKTPEYQLALVMMLQASLAQYTNDTYKKFHG